MPYSILISLVNIILDHFKKWLPLSKYALHGHIINDDFFRVAKKALKMEFSSVFELESARPKMSGPIASNTTLDDIAAHCNVRPEYFENDGLGLWGCIILKSPSVGFVSITGSKISPEYGCTIWFQAGVNQTVLAKKLTEFLSPLEIEFFSSETGKPISNTTLE